MKLVLSSRIVVRRLWRHCIRLRRRVRTSSLLRKPRQQSAVKVTVHANEKISSYEGSKPAVKAPREYSEQMRALHSLKLLQESVLEPEDEEEDYSLGLHRRRPSTPLDYSLAIDFTAAKIVNSVILKCKQFQCISSLYKEESHGLLATVVGLQEILQIILGLSNLTRYLEVLEDIILYSSKAFAFMEKLCFKQLPNSNHGVHKTAVKMSEFACQFYSLTLRLCEEYKKGGDNRKCLSCTEERPSFGVSTYQVPIHNVAERLRKNKRVQIVLTEVDGKSAYNVELSYPRKWFSKDVAMSAKIESSDRGFSQTLQADRVKIEKGSWGWEEAQDTVLITYDDLVVANVASVSGSLLSCNKQTSFKESHSPKPSTAQTYRTSIQIVGSSRIDLDLQNLFIKGTKDKDNVYYKCFVNVNGREEVLGIYRYQEKQFLAAEGALHIVGRGNQPGLRHVLVSIFSSLGFTPSA